MEENVSTDPRTRIPPINSLIQELECFFEQPLRPELATRLARLLAQQLRESDTHTITPALLKRLFTPLLQPGPNKVINGTGILLHTNLGRAPLGADLIAAAIADVEGYTDLEMDLSSGKRGHRDRHFASLAQLVWGVEDAMLVNNAAAGLALAIAGLGGGGETIVSRGELIEIGGNFRLPDIMALAGSKLVEVGTTNKTKLRDFEEALNPKTACLLKTHPSNFRIEGFTSAVSLKELVALGQRQQVPVVMDLGSGLSEALPFPAIDEPTIEDHLAANPDVLLFSGDKLFGSVQAGILLGKHTALNRLRSHPLNRMLRPDKLTISILCHHLKAIALGQSNPLSQLASQSLSDLKTRALALQEQLHHLDLEIIEADGYMGGGSLPQERRSSYALTFTPANPEQFAKAMRCGSLPVVGYLRQDRYWINLASVFPAQDADLAKALQQAWTSNPAD